ncbi:MAG: lipid A biosynthesis acyltransferase [Sphingobacteriia bacterium]|nr:MAG: lipid A biosynthesis acyltransferase [Sphingobacteriia bacterium]TAG29801.1 MAG: lipid A biosynthesis acyltransferase [Sphingobacteriia bacterium]TAH06338.1 MAG: lipid A biosynthesis acyltransferase [Sphingobacteriia bacterium]
MYYIIYPLLYLLSLLPWRLLYFIADGLYVLAYYLIGYRKAEVMKNLAIAFPEKTELARLRIAKDFYHNFIDTIIETIKLLSVSDQTLQKRFTCNIDLLNNLYSTGQNVQLQCGHFFNWEIINLNISRLSKFPFVGVYQPLTNQVMNKIMLNMRQRNGTILVPANKFKTHFRTYVKDRYALGLAADQNPPSALKAHWVPFFGRLTPFVIGPEKGAKLNNTIVVFAHFYKVKRGYYHTQFEIITQDPNAFEAGQLTKIYAAYVERAVRLKPANYLWSHRRWKFTYNELEHGHLRVH